jgi:hypothetical protein
LSAIRDAERKVRQPRTNGSDETRRQIIIPVVNDPPHRNNGPEGAEDCVDYEECILSAPCDRNLLDLSVAEIGKLAIDVVAAEGPVHTEEVTRRIREAFGLQRAGNRISNHVGEALSAEARKGGVKCEGEFWTIPGREIKIIRSRRFAALQLRRACMIAPAEYQIAILRIIEGSVAISTDELGVETARRFGFDRTGPELRQGINTQISALAGTGKISIEGSKARALATSEVPKTNRPVKPGDDRGVWRSQRTRT